MVRTPERRLVARRPCAAGEALHVVRLRGGREGRVVDVSSLGALIESEARLLPGTSIDAQWATAQGRLIVVCRVVRASVATVTAERVAYRAALRFDHAIDLPHG